MVSFIISVITLNLYVIVNSLQIPMNDNTYHINETSRNIGNGSTSLSNETSLSNFTYSLKNVEYFDISFSVENDSSVNAQVDCFGLGTAVARGLALFFMSKPYGSNALNVKFMLSSRKQPQRVYIVPGKQFGLEWTDFDITRRTVVIVHGFLSHGGEEWIADMEQAFLQWGDVNVLIVDWSDGGNTWNYYKAAVNTRTVGHQISSILEQLMNVTLIDHPNTENWGPLHLVGHSLGAHICGFAAKEFRKHGGKWQIKRITGLDPAQPCFNNQDQSMHLHKTDAHFVDVIHTNGRLLTSFGLGLPHSLGDVDFYPNGGKVQPGCLKEDLSVFRFLPIPKKLLEQTICSHGRSYIYLTESLKFGASSNCSFWAHHWDLTFRNIQYTISQPCTKENCTQMGIQAELFPQRGTFFVSTSNSPPFCDNTTEIIDEVKKQLIEDHADDIED